ncbi:nucleotidyltransferase family protein [Pseudomonas cremoricolorata]|uniref:nucleotidyltransferase family protein n=1 Tax=Pseudomonas cremoricolorata TaxID=157783 RepID=UPI00041CFDD4|nr:nucleotidyltransferase family protein [Pseudomonas cremoricolorata]
MNACCDRESALRSIIRNDPLRWRLLGVVNTLQLPDCWIGAGFVRNAVWDHLHGRSSSPIVTDVDVIWFDADACSVETDRALEQKLQVLAPGVKWSVKNQARMHLNNGDAAYLNANDAMRHWPETATAVAVRQSQEGHCEVAAPLGLADLFELRIRPAGQFAAAKASVFRQRLNDKGWLITWPLLRVCAENSTGSR